MFTLPGLTTFCPWGTSWYISLLAASWTRCCQNKEYFMCLMWRHPEPQLVSTKDTQIQSVILFRCLHTSDRESRSDGAQQNDAMLVSTGPRLIHLLHRSPDMGGAAAGHLGASVQYDGDGFALQGPAVRLTPGDKYGAIGSGTHTITPWHHGTFLVRSREYA